MPGKIVRVMVEEGQAVENGQGLVVVEAMKMQNEIKVAQSRSDQSGARAAGRFGSAGQALLVVE